MATTVRGVDYTGALTSIGTGHAGTNKIISRAIWKEMGYGSFFAKNGFVGKENDKGKPIWEKKDLIKQKGDQVTFLLRRNLDRTTAHVTADGALVGNETPLSYDDFAVVLDQYRKAVILNSALDEQRFIGDLRVDAKELLRQWADENQDYRIFVELGNTPSRVIYPGTIVADTGFTEPLDAAELMTPDVILKAKLRCKLDHVWPLMIQGREHYILVMHPEQAYDLQKAVGDGTWQTIMRDAEKRGKENPLFTGALGVYQGVILYEHENCPILPNALGGTPNQDGADAYIMGMGALVRAWGGYRATNAPVRMVEQDFEDYGDMYAAAVAMIQGLKKAVFNSVDFGVGTVRTGISTQTYT